MAPCDSRPLRGSLSSKLRRSEYLYLFSVNFVTTGVDLGIKEIITLYLQRYLTPSIVAKTKHSKEAVDRYIRDYEKVKVVRAATADIDTISQILRLSQRVITQYLDLIPEHHLQTLDANLAKQEEST